MLQFLTSISYSGIAPKEICVGKVAHPDPVDGGRLLHVQVILRHGARAPSMPKLDVFKSLEHNDWFCNEDDALSPHIYPAPIVHPKNYRQVFDERLLFFKPSCRSKDLLTLGMDQLRELGSEYRRYLVNETKLLPDRFHPDNVLVRSTRKDRAIRSAISFIEGLHPSRSPNEHINLMTDSNSASFLNPSEKQCAELKGINADYLNSKEFAEEWEKLKKFEGLFKEHGLDFTNKTFQSFASYVVIADCSDHKIPDWVTPELVNASLHFNSLLRFGRNSQEKYFGFAASPLFREFIRQADEFLSLEAPQKLVVMGSHISALAAMLPVLGHVEEYGPAVASHLSMELWEVNDEVMARFVYNGKPIKVSFMGSELFSYSNFKYRMSVNGYLNHCFL